MLRLCRKRGATAGRTIASGQVAFLREFIAAHPGQQPLEAVAAVVRSAGMEAGQRRATRRGLPRSAADAGAGRRDRVAAGALPASAASAATARPRPEAGADRHHADARRAARAWARSRFAGAAHADEPLFNSLIEQYHYLGYEQPVGEHLKYLVWAAGPADRLSGVVSRRRGTWAAATASSAGRRGAAAQHPLGRLQHALSDSAVGRGAAPGLAHAGADGGRDLGGLAAALRASDLFLETFVDPERFRGTCYRAANWMRAGTNHGRGKDDQTQPAEPVDQRGAGLSAAPAVSRSYCRKRKR